MSEIINARSPFYIKKISNPSEQANNEDLFLVKFDIYIYSGLVSNYTPGSPTYQINKYVKNETDNFVLIEVSELIRDYLETEYYIETIAEWAKKRNIRLRNDKGQFAKGNYNSIGYVLARGIFEPN